jgi:hypothetical protein
MAKRARRKVNRRAKKRTKGRKMPVARRAKASSKASGASTRRRPVKKKAARRPTRKSSSAAKHAAPPAKSARIDRARRMLPDETMRTPPSSLDMDRRASAAKSGRKSLDESIRQHTGMTPALTGGDVDADWENAYFSGDEAPGGDNLTPDQEDVDDMGRALGVEYQDSEELQGSDKVIKRDAHRWELDPASSDDYKDRR